MGLKQTAFFGAGWRSFEAWPPAISKIDAVAAPTDTLSTCSWCCMTAASSADGMPFGMQFDGGSYRPTTMPSASDALIAPTVEFNESTILL